MSVKEVKGCKEGGGKLSLDEGRGEGLQRGGGRRAHNYNRLKMARILERNIDIEEEGMERDEN